MAKFLTTLEVSARIEKIIRESIHEITLISPYLKLSKILFDRLKDTDKRNIKIRLIYGKKELSSEEFRLLSELVNLELYFYENLHAKCYFNEDLMVITSLNLHEFSQANNREMGILIKRKEDEKLYNDAVKEAKSILQNSSKVIIGRTSSRI